VEKQEKKLFPDFTVENGKFFMSPLRIVAQRL